MNDKASLVFMVGLGILCSLAALIFTLWLIGALLVDAIKNCRGTYKRIPYRRLDSNYRRKQFWIPPNQRDWK